jgi:hypothetical protein
MAKPDRFAHDFCDTGSRAPPSLPVARHKSKVLQNMPARFLTAEQRRCYGCLPGKLSADVLARADSDDVGWGELRLLRDPNSEYDF